MNAKIIYDKNYKIATVDRRMGGSFVEHLNRCMYGGIYEKDHPMSDKLGFRKDVKELIKKFDVRLLRYPGGNFVSAYNWKDGIGPKEKRPIRYDLAWECTESNEVGIDEFAKYASELETELMLSVNLGTGTPKEAAELVEYCNIEGGTYYSNLRKKNGSEKPYNVRIWCVGNEVDGSWQIGQMDPDTYVKKYRETAKMMRRVDPRIELVACGSCSNEPMHQSFGYWDRIILDNAYEWIDYLSLHRYYGFDVTQDLVYPRIETIRDVAWMPKDLDGMIHTIASLIKYEKGLHRSKHDVFISLDELGILPKKEKHSSGTVYDSFTEYDAVLLGGLFCVLLNHSDVVKICCQSLLTNENGMFSVFSNGSTIVQPIAFPFKDFSDCVGGVVLRHAGEYPTIETEHYGTVPCAYSACVYFEDLKEIRVLVSNFSMDSPIEIQFSFGGFDQINLVEWKELFSENPIEKNSEVFPDKICPSFRKIDSSERVILKPHSWNVLRYSVS